MIDSITASARSPFTASLFLLSGNCFTCLCYDYEIPARRRYLHWRRSQLIASIRSIENDSIFITGNVEKWYFEFGFEFNRIWINGESEGWLCGLMMTAIESFVVLIGVEEPMGLPVADGGVDSVDSVARESLSLLQWRSSLPTMNYRLDFSFQLFLLHYDILWRYFEDSWWFSWVSYSFLRLC